jgi:hypothetical protein
LIVDEESPQALPNLDFKIMQGNSLVEELEGVNLRDIMKSGSKDGLLLFVERKKHRIRFLSKSQSNASLQ